MFSKAMKNPNSYSEPKSRAFCFLENKVDFRKIKTTPCGTESTVTNRMRHFMQNMQEAAIPRIALTPVEAAISTGRTRTRIFQAIRNQEMTARRDGKATLIEVAELRRWASAMPSKGRDATMATAA